MAFNLDALASKLGGIVENVGDYAGRALDLYSRVRDAERTTRHAVRGDKGKAPRGQLAPEVEPARPVPDAGGGMPTWLVPVGIVAVVGVVLLARRR